MDPNGTPADDAGDGANPEFYPLPDAVEGETEQATESAEADAGADSSDDA